MANNDIDDILTRLDEIKKLQAELRHLVPRVAGNSSRHTGPQDLTSDESASTRFPSLFTFPEIPSLASSAKSGRVQRSTAYLNLNNELSLSDDQSSTAYSTNARRPTKAKSSVREMRGANNVVARSHARNSVVPNASTSAANSVRTTPYLTKSSTASRVVKHLQGAIGKGLNNAIASTDKTSRTTVERPNLAAKKGNNSIASKWYIVRIIFLIKLIKFCITEVHFADPPFSFDSCQYCAISCFTCLSN